MTILLNVTLALGLAGLVGLLVAYSIRKGREVVGQAFGLPGPDEPKPREADPPPRWVFPRGGAPVLRHGRVARRRPPRQGR